MIKSSFLPSSGLLLLVGLVMGGCTTPCDQIARDREAFRAQTAPATDAPHLLALVPLALANEIISPQVEAFAPTRLQIPGAGLLGPFLNDLEMRPRQARLVPAGGAGLGLELELEVTMGGAPLFSLNALGAIQPQLDAANRRVAIEVRPSDFDAVSPRIEAGAAERLAESILGALPSMARLIISPQQVASGASLVIQLIVSQSYPLLRDQVLVRLGPIARFEVILPDLPIDRLEVSTVAERGGGLRIAAHTTLPVRQGLSATSLAVPDGSAATIRLSGSTVAQLANWAMAEGQLPRRFDEQGHPRDDGPFEVGLDWVGGDEPLRVHVWRLEPSCLRAVLRARPELRVEGDQIALDIQEVHVDQIEGPPWAGLARMFSGVWLRALRRSQTAAGSLEFSVGGRPLRGQVTAVRRDGDEVEMTLALREAPPEG